MHTNHKISNCSIVIARSGECVAVFILARGFTGHEHILAFNLINMNARIYDPEIASFISPDNEITYPENPQNYNRYSYAMNNPLKYTDPSGNNPFAVALQWIFANTLDAYGKGGFNAAIQTATVSGIGLGISGVTGSYFEKWFGTSIGAKIGSALTSSFLTSMVSSGNGKYTLMQALATSLNTLQSIGLDYLSNIGNSSQNEGTARNESNTKEEAQNNWNRLSQESKDKIIARYSTYATDMSDQNRTTAYEVLFEVYEYNGRQEVAFYKSNEVPFDAVRREEGILVKIDRSTLHYSEDANVAILSSGSVIIEGHFHPTLVLAGNSVVQIPFTTFQLHKTSRDFVLRGTKPSPTDYEGSNGQIKYIYDGYALQYYLRIDRKDYTGELRW